MKRCVRCLMPDTRPRMLLGLDGVCPACSWRDEYEKTDWQARKYEFQDLLRKHRGHPAYDCVVPFSGGKDSAAIAYRLKYEYGLKPLLVTYGQLMWTDVGRHNWHKVRDDGFDIIYWGADQRVSRILARRFFVERGHPKQHYDAAVNSVPVIVAKHFNIPLIIYAEHGESFYGGHILSEDHRRRRYHDEVLENQVGDDPGNWVMQGITSSDLFPYIYPEDAGDIECVYWSHYHRWDIYENAKLMREKLDFKWAEPRSTGSFEGFDSIDDRIDDLDFYMMYVKFLFGRATRMASRMIQCGHMTREEGMRLARVFDGEPPAEDHMREILEYLDMTKEDFDRTVDKHRNPEMWNRENGIWKPNVTFV